VAARLEPAEAARACGRAARALAHDLERASHAVDRLNLARALSSVAARLEPAEAARACGRAARAMADDLERPFVDFLLSGRSFSQSRIGASIGARLEPTEAAEIARRLADALGRLPQAVGRGRLDAHDGGLLASSLSSVAARLEPAAAAEIARRLADALGRATGADARLNLASGLSSVAARLEPAGAARVCEEAIRGFLRTRPEGLRGDRIYYENLYQFIYLIYNIDPGIARQVVKEIAGWICSQSDDMSSDHYLPTIPSPSSSLRVPLLNSLLPDNSRVETVKRASRLAEAVTVGQGIGGALYASLMVVTEPIPCRLTTQELVELLKMPTCYGESRRVVLDQLGHIHGRHFVNHWAFVRFAREHHLDVDLTSPPQRPDPRESVRRMLDALGVQ
jgi:hypothetical protein